MSSSTTPNPTSPTFTLFRRLPIELQDQIWTHAAATPKIQFLLLQDDYDILYCESPYSIIPHPESGVRTHAALSSVCRTAQAAVGRHNKAAKDATTIAGLVEYRLVPGERVKTYSLDLDLQNDLVCFGPPERTVTPMVGAVRKFAMRFKPGWGRSGEEISGHVDGKCSSSPYLMSAERLGLCSGCMLVFLRKFEQLEELYFILDEADVQGELWADAERRSPSVGRRACNLYSRTYFEVDMSGESAGVQVTSKVLERLKAKLMDTTNAMPWAAKLKIGLLTRREDTPA